MILFPQPRRLQLFDGTYCMPRQSAGDSLVAFFRALQAGTQGVSLSCDSVLPQEAYRILIDASGVRISYSSEEGLFRAATSLRQMIVRFQGQLPHMHIEDAPELKKRGYMMDVNCGRIPKMETLKSMIDFLASLKYNEFQLYMEGGCFKYSAYPEETADIDCLTPENIRELDAYCAERFIDFVPNQNSFGHMRKWLQKPHFRHLGLFGSDNEVPNTLNPLLPESFDFMRNLYASLLPNYSSKYVNIGLDEAYGLGKYQIESHCKEKGNDVVFMEWLNKLSSHIEEAHGKSVMFWADMIYNYPESYHMVPKDAIALEWGYELIQSQRMTAHCIDYQNAGVKYYVCPSVNTHGSFTSRMDVTTFNIRTCAELAAEYGAEGMLLTEWGEVGHPYSWIWCLTPAALAGQYAWNTGAKQDGETFKADFIRSAEDFVDEAFFAGAKVSRHMYRMANYYLLEPERVHVCTMCAKQLSLPISQTRYAHLFDLKDSGDDFYFDNVTAYVRRIMEDIEKISLDERLKREIRLTAKLITLGSEVCKVKLHPKESAGDVPALTALIDEILPEYTELWQFRNFETGIELFIDQLNKRKSELLALTK